MTTILKTFLRRNWNALGSCQMYWMWWRMQHEYFRLITIANTNDTKDETDDEETQTNTYTRKHTHPTHTQVGGWGLQPVIVTG